MATGMWGQQTVGKVMPWVTEEGKGSGERTKCNGSKGTELLVGKEGPELKVIGAVNVRIQKN